MVYAEFPGRVSGGAERRAGTVCRIITEIDRLSTGVLQPHQRERERQVEVRRVADSRLTQSRRESRHAREAVRQIFAGELDEALIAYGSE